MSQNVLNVFDHRRDRAGLRYVYPVISRRAGGVSVGINLNPNRACNWRCIYCQVTDLQRGSAPPVDLELLEHELRGFLNEVVQGDFMARCVPEGARRLNDIALSGDGEPTSAAEFLQVVELIGRVRAEIGVPAEVKLVLISNGSLLHRPDVQAGLRSMAALNGELWFKLDRATEAGIAAVNDTRITLDKVRANLQAAVAACPVWLQTCWFATDGVAPDPVEEQAYLDFLADLLRNAIPLQGVLLYGIARPSMQPEAQRISALPQALMEKFASRIHALGIEVKVSA